MSRVSDLVRARDSVVAPCVVCVEIESVIRHATLLVPTGVRTPYEATAEIVVDGGTVDRKVAADDLGLSALLVRPRCDAVSVRYHIARPTGSDYPEKAFLPRRNRYTVAAAELADASLQVSRDAGGGAAAIEALAAEAHARFEYAHPECRFNDDHDSVPYLACGRTPGSCVDINTYFVASLRAAGFEAAYMYGYFFPEERGGVTNDMHCWVVTRHDGDILEWDIAHHIKAGLRKIRPKLNPKPGRRVAIGHSMGHAYRLPEAVLDLKLLAEPVWVTADGVVPAQPIRIVIKSAPD